MDGCIQLGRELTLDVAYGVHVGFDVAQVGF